MDNSGLLIARHRFSTRLQSLRKERDLTQKQLAEQINTSISSIISYENAQRFPSSAVIGLLCQFFNVRKEYLLGETDERETGYTWDNSDITAAMRESFPAQISDLNDALKSCSAQEKQLTFDILVRLRYVLNLKDVSTKMTALSMLHDVAAAVGHLTGDNENHLQ